MLEYIGWVATALFASSYLFKQPNALRCVQAVAALMWIGYGLVIQAYPVVVSNMAVAVMAMVSFGLDYRRRQKEESREATLLASPPPVSS